MSRPIHAVLDKAVKQLGYLRRNLSAFDLQNTVESIADAQWQLVHSEVYQKADAVDLGVSGAKPQVATFTWNAEAPDFVPARLGDGACATGIPKDSELNACVRLGLISNDIVSDTATERVLECLLPSSAPEKFVQIPTRTIIEKIVEVPVLQEKIVYVPREIVKEVVVEKLVEVPTEVIKEIIVEKVIEVPKPCAASPQAAAEGCLTFTVEQLRLILKECSDESSKQTAARMNEAMQDMAHKIAVLEHQLEDTTTIENETRPSKPKKNEKPTKGTTAVATQMKSAQSREEAIAFQVGEKVYMPGNKAGYREGVVVKVLENGYTNPKDFYYAVGTQKGDTIYRDWDDLQRGS